MFFRIFSSFLILVTVTCAGRDLPSYFPKCNIDDPKLNDCLLNATRIMKPLVVKGIKEIRLPAFDPLVLSSLAANQDRGNFRYNITFTGFTVRGLEDYDFDEITFNPKTLTLKGSVRFNNVTYEGNYSVEGYLFYFPVLGSGFMQTHLEAVNGTFEVKGLLRTHKNADHYFPQSAKVRAKVTGYSEYRTVESNPELGHLITELINLNGQRIADAATPVLEVIVEGILMKFMTTLSKLVPYNKLFPHS